MENPGSSQTTDVIQLLDEEDRAIKRLFEEFSSPAAQADHVKRAGIGLELRDRLAVQDAAKQELVHATLEDTGDRELAEAIDHRAQRRRQLLARLDELTAGVSARDVHVGSGEEFDRTVIDLRDQVSQDLDFEQSQVLPRLRQRLSAEELAKLAGRVEKVRKRAPTHPRADTPLEHQGNPLVRRAKAAVDHLRDFADAPHHSEDRT